MTCDEKGVPNGKNSPADAKDVVLEETNSAAPAPDDKKETSAKETPAKETPAKEPPSPTPLPPKEDKDEKDTTTKEDKDNTAAPVPLKEPLSLVPDVRNYYCFMVNCSLY